MTSTSNDRDERSPGNERLRARNPIEFFTQVRQEARRVTWATRQEVVVSTIMVFIMVTAAVLFFWIVDLILRYIVQTFLLP